MYYLRITKHILPERTGYTGALFTLRTRKPHNIENHLANFDDITVQPDTQSVVHAALSFLRVEKGVIVTSDDLVIKNRTSRKDLIP